MAIVDIDDDALASKHECLTSSLNASLSLVALSRPSDRIDRQSISHFLETRDSTVDTRAPSIFMMCLNSNTSPSSSAEAAHE